MEGLIMDGDDLIHTHLENQESILQATRDMHYVFQALFIGLAIALLAIAFSFSPDQPLPFWEFDSQKVLFLILIASNVMMVIFGLMLLNEYAANIYKRGVVIDALQHFRLLRYQGLLDKYLNQLFKAYGNDYLFVIIKVIERAASNFGKYYRDFSSFERSKYQPVPKGTEFAGIASFERLSYVLFFNDIYDVGHVELGHNDLKKRRDISSTRSGHRRIFWSIWLLDILLTVLLLFHGSS